MKEFRKRGIESVISQAKKTLDGRPVYITFDLDCLDPTIAPAVANLEASSIGFNIDEAISLIRLTRGMNVIGGDIVCMMPTKDNPNNITAHTAMAIMFEMICVMAENKKNS
jgi:guanidinopropionase